MFVGFCVCQECPHHSVPAFLRPYNEIVLHTWPFQGDTLNPGALSEP